MTEETLEAKAQLDSLVRHMIPAVDAIDPGAPDDAVAHLNQSHPFDGADVTRIFELCERGLDEGWLAPHEAGPKVRFGRLGKDIGGYAVDVVVMESGTARGHTHTTGEINMCFALNGNPKFDGHDPGWVVYAPGSHHIPTVTDGTMLFVYFTPGGEIVWDPVETGTMHD